MFSLSKGFIVAIAERGRQIEGLDSTNYHAVFNMFNIQCLSFTNISERRYKLFYSLLLLVRDLLNLTAELHCYIKLRCTLKLTDHSTLTVDLTAAFNSIINLEVQATTAHLSQLQNFRIYPQETSPGEIT